MTRPINALSQVTIPADPGYEHVPLPNLCGKEVTIKSLRFDPVLPTGSKILDIREGKNSTFGSCTPFDADILEHLPPNIGRLQANQDLTVLTSVESSYTGVLRAQMDYKHPIPIRPPFFLVLGSRTQMAGKVSHVIASKKGLKLLQKIGPTAQFCVAGSAVRPEQKAPVSFKRDGRKLFPSQDITLEPSQALNLNGLEPVESSGHFVAVLDSLFGER